MYGAKYHINLQNLPHIQHYNSKSTTSMVHREQTEERSVEQREIKMISVEDPVQLFSESLYRWQIMR